MHRIGLMVTGFVLGFATVAFAVAAIVLFGVGVGGHFLAVRDAGAARVISFDPSTVAARAPVPAILALTLSAVFAAVYMRLRRNDAISHRG